MSRQTDNIILGLLQFGLTEEEAKVYLNLLEKRTSTALGISRNLRMGRTRVYRILDKLIGKELVAQKLDSGGFKFVANEISNLNFLVSKKEAELNSLRETLPELQKSLEHIVGVDVAGSKVMFYRGAEGLSAVNWNLLRAKSGILSYEVSTAIAYMPMTEAEKLRQALVQKQIFIRTLMNVTHMDPFTKVTELVEKFWEVKSIPENILNIKADIFIYNDIYTVCNYLEEKDVFCIEIQNKIFTDMQRQVFENLWKQAKVMKKLGNEGSVMVSDML